MPPVEHHSHASGHDRLQTRLWRPRRFDHRGTGRTVESSVELDTQAGTLAQRECAKHVPFENVHIHSDGPKSDTATAGIPGKSPAPAGKVFGEAGLREVSNEQGGARYRAAALVSCAGACIFG
jgi:hypothetical protein